MKTKLLSAIASSRCPRSTIAFSGSRSMGQKSPRSMLIGIGDTGMLSKRASALAVCNFTREKGGIGVLGLQETAAICTVCGSDQFCGVNVSVECVSCCSWQGLLSIRTLTIDFGSESSATVNEAGNWPGSCPVLSNTGTTVTLARTGAKGQRSTHTLFSTSVGATVRLAAHGCAQVPPVAMHPQAASNVQPLCLLHWSSCK
jgi:hypothetical protein